MLRHFQLNRILWTLCAILISGSLPAGERTALKELNPDHKAAGSQPAGSKQSFNKFKTPVVRTSSIPADTDQRLKQALEHMKHRIPAAAMKKTLANPPCTNVPDRIFSKKQPASIHPFLSRFKTSFNRDLNQADRVWRDETGDNAICVKFATGNESLKKSSPLTVAEMNELGLNAIESQPSCFRLDSPREELRLIDHSQDNLGFTHMRYEQFYKGLQLRGCELVVHISPSAQVNVINGRIRSTPSHLLNENYSVTGDDAVQYAQKSLGIKKDGVTEIRTEKIIYQDQDSEPCLAWRIEVSISPFLVHTVHVDGKNGTILNKTHNMRNDGSVTGSAKDLLGTTRTVNLYQEGTQFYMIDLTKDMYSGWDDSNNLPDGALIVWNCNGTVVFDESTGEVADAFNPNISTSSQKTAWRQDEGSASYNISLCYDYYKVKYGRKGMDDKDMPMWVHINADYENACQMSGTPYFIFGNGDSECQPYIRALDVLAHEYGHGITSFTSRLEYENQSGALNEAFSDYSGVVVEHYAGSGNWQMGENALRASSGYSCLRDLANPHNADAASQQPATMSEYEHLNMDQDYGGVHVNCTIPGHAMYLISQKIGFEKMESLIYRTYTQYLVPLAQFVDFRIGALQAAEDLGFTDTEKNQIGQAFDEVEIVGGSGTSAPDPYEPVSGAAYVLGVDPNDGMMMRLESTLPYSEDKLTWFNAYTNNKPSISEDGSVVVYINLDGQLCLYFPETGENNVIESEGITWHNVALSPRGDYMALIPDPEEYPSTLIIWNLTNDDQSIRTLYLPSQTEGTQFTADYADILDWTNDGGYLIYDCCLSLDSEAHGDWLNWSICMTSAADERYTVVLAAGNDLIYGNPSISSTRDYVIAFDVIDLTNGAENPAYFMATYDMANGVFGVIAQNDHTFGHPSFSPDDSKIVFQDLNSSSEYYLTQIDLNPDKLNGNESTLKGWIKPVEYPVWYATGSRPGSGGGTGHVIFSENFDDWNASGAFPPAGSGWSLETTNASSTWGLWNPDPEFGTIDPDNQYSAYILFDFAKNQYEVLKSPKITLQGNPMYLEFYVYYASEWLNSYNFILDLWDGATAERIWKLENDGNNYEWKKFTVEIPDRYTNMEVYLNWIYSGLDGFSVGLDGISLTSQTTAVDNKASLPEAFSVSNYPNPFNPSTTIQFSVPERQKVRISVYNTAGQKIEELVNSIADAGINQTVWDASQYPSGLYFIRMNCKSQSMTQKCMLVK